MSTLAALLVVFSALVAGFLLGQNFGTPRCGVCHKPLLRVRPGGRCGDTKDVTA